MSDLDGSAVASLRRLNGAKVLGVLRTEAYRKFTVREMSIATGLSRPTVARLLDDLQEIGWALSAEGKPGATGRPARRYWFNRLRGLLVSADLGLRGMALMVTDLIGTELYWDLSFGEEAPSTELAAERMLSAVDGALEGLSSEYDKLPVLAFSISVPIHTDTNGHIVDSLNEVEGWRGGDLVTPVKDHFGDIPVVVANDLMLAAEAELNLGALRDARQGLLVYLAQYSAVVLISNGRVHEGSTHVAGDIGSLAEYRWPDALQEARVATGFNDPPRTQPIIDAANAGDLSAQAALATLGQKFTRGVVDVAALWDPDIIVFAGQLADAGPLVMEPIERGLHELAQDDFDIRAAKVDANKGSCLGGVIRALDAVSWNA